MSPSEQPLPPIDIAHLRRWVGRSRSDEDTLRPRHAQLMAATVDRADVVLTEGAPLPPLWHWLYFLEAQPPSALGPDGHAARGGFLPPVPLANRMWAGGRIEWLAPLVLGRSITKRSTVLRVEHKQGRSGDLVFVTIGHALFDGDRLCLNEEQDLVYRSPSPPTGPSGLSEPPSAQASATPAATHSRPFVPDATLLFRYSALTFNGHRIHYDLAHCRQVEGYADLVVHGPLVATLLAQLAVDVAAKQGVALRRFVYRGLRPALLGQALTLYAEPAGQGLRLWSALADGQASMQAEAHWA